MKRTRSVGHRQGRKGVEYTYSGIIDRLGLDRVVVPEIVFESIQPQSLEQVLHLSELQTLVP